MESFLKNLALDERSFVLMKIIRFLLKKLGNYQLFLRELSEFKRDLRWDIPLV